MTIANVVSNVAFLPLLLRCASVPLHSKGWGNVYIMNYTSNTVWLKVPLNYFLLVLFFDHKSTAATCYGMPLSSVQGKDKAEQTKSVSSNRVQARKNNNMKQSGAHVCKNYCPYNVPTKTILCHRDTRTYMLYVSMHWRRIHTRRDSSRK
jgi:hypothetical protein